MQVLHMMLAHIQLLNSLDKINKIQLLMMVKEKKEG